MDFSKQPNSNWWNVKAHGETVEFKRDLPQLNTQGVFCKDKLYNNVEEDVSAQGQHMSTMDSSPKLEQFQDQDKKNIYELSVLNIKPICRAHVEESIT